MDHPLGRVIEDEVKRAEADLEAFRSRALTLIGLSGGLVALTSGLTAIAAGARTDVLPDHGPGLLALALAGYVAAAICALMANLPRDVTPADADALEDLVSQWDEDGWDRSVAAMLSKYLVSLRSINDEVAKWLTRAIKLTIVGMAATAFLGLAVVRHVTG